MTTMAKILTLFAAVLLLAPNGAAAQNREVRLESASTDMREDRVLFAVKTNLLYDAALTMPTLELEVPVGDRLSVLFEDVFPWWLVGNKYCLEHWAMGPEFRFWFRGSNPLPKEKLSGWFVGAYGMSAKYDFQYLALLDYQGEYWSAGISAGWSKILHGRKKNFRARPFRLEFSVCAGYLSTNYRHYLPTDDYSQLIRDKYNAGTVSYFGPTKVKVSFVVPIWGKTDKTKTK